MKSDRAGKGNVGEVGNLRLDGTMSGQEMRGGSGNYWKINLQREAEVKMWRPLNDKFKILELNTGQWEP